MGGSSPISPGPASASSCGARTPPVMSFEWSR
jgi:hypothetical protein